MIIRGSHYLIHSRNASTDFYWGQGAYPEWTALALLQDHPNQAIGTGVEPHYHDHDEMWLFYEGRGEVWLDDQRFEVTPNTFVYTPMGAVHRFLMFRNYGNVSIVTRLEREKRAAHLWVDRDDRAISQLSGARAHLPKRMRPVYVYGGAPTPTVAGFVAPGMENDGPIQDPNPRCPLRECRMLALPAGLAVEEVRLAGNEHWVVVDGLVRLAVDDYLIELCPGDVALLRAGLMRKVSSLEDAQVALVRE